MTDGMKSGSGENPFDEYEQRDDDDVSDGGDEDEWVRVQFRIPEELRTELNEVGYAKLRLALNERGVDGVQKRELQRAAVQMLLDNPEEWADVVEDLDG